MSIRPENLTAIPNYIIKAAFLILLLGVTSTASARIYKWIDNNGAVHYGDEIPAQYKNQKQNINAGDMSVINYKPAPDAAAKPAAKENKKTNNRNRPAVKQQAADPNQARPMNKTASTCAEKWAAYNASSACYTACSTHTVYHGKNISQCHCSPVIEPSCQQ